jgi:CO dehydrogenase nickel-insertion accessory protein CooC1
MAKGVRAPMGNLFRLLFSSLHFELQDMVIVDTAHNIDGETIRLHP